MAKFSLFFLLSLIFSQSIPLNITVCDCNSPKTVGLWDSPLPSYCTPEKVYDSERETLYYFHLNEEPHATFEGHACWAWLHEKKIVGSFLYTFDTTIRKSIIQVTDEDCWKMANSKDCYGNKMITTGDTATFHKEPIGEGRWWSTEIYTSRQCEVQNITLHKECPLCPIESPYGLLSDSPYAKTDTHKNIRIGWRMPNLFANPRKFKLRGIKYGRGFLHSNDNETIRLTDTKNQLDYIFYNRSESIENKTVYPLVNLKNSFIELFPDPRTTVRFRNMNSSQCLAINTSFALITTPCEDDHPNQHFQIGKDNVVFKDERTFHQKSQSVFPKALFNYIDDYVDEVIRYDSTDNTLHVATHQCIQESRRLDFVFFTPCINTANPPMFNNHKWEVLKNPSPTIKIQNEERDNDTLLMQHHQFIEDNNLDKVNALIKEIKQIYCGNLLVRRHTTVLLAAQSGILAANSLNLPKCSRVKSYGMNLLVQQCAPKIVKVFPRTTECGIEPVLNDNYTIAADGYSLHPFPPRGCYWPSNLFNFNGDTYYYNGSDWIKRMPTQHFSNIRLINKFKAVPDNEVKYLPDHHPMHNKREFEPYNVMIELASSIMESDSTPISTLILNSETTTHGFSLTSWTSSITAGLMGIIIVTVLIGTCFLCFYCGCAQPIFQCCTGTLCSCMNSVRSCVATCCTAILTKPAIRHSHQVPIEHADNITRWEDNCIIPTPNDIIALSPIVNRLRSPTVPHSYNLRPTPPTRNTRFSPESTPER